MTSHKLFPTATIRVPESQRDAYSAIADDVSRRLETIPDEVRGISRMRNWILRRFDEHAIVMADDDIKSCISLVALRRRTLLPDEIMAMLENTAYRAAGAGAGIFGWHQRADPRLLARNNSIATTHWVGGVLGVVGRGPHWDELLTCKCDIDACLREFMERRIVWQDSRFCFEQERDTNMGGNSMFRTEERIKAERRYLKSKWKARIYFEESKSQDRASISVQRKQPFRTQFLSLSDKTVIDNNPLLEEGWGCFRTSLFSMIQNRREDRIVLDALFRLNWINVDGVKRRSQKFSADR